MPLTDEELVVFLGLTPEDGDHMKFVRGLSLEKRATFERMSDLVNALNLWKAGLGPKPTGVLID